MQRRRGPPGIRGPSLPCYREKLFGLLINRFNLVDDRLIKPVLAFWE
jgi:hypothetical protein